MEITKIDKYKMFFVTGDKNIARELDGISVTSTPNLYWVPITQLKAYDVLDFMERNDFDAKLLEDNLADIEFEYFETQSEIHFEVDAILRDYQNKVADRINSVLTFGLFMEQRLGKTPTSIIAIKDYSKIVISVPNGLQVSWQRAWKQFANRDVVIVKGTPARRKKLYKEFKDSEKMVLVGSIDTLASDTKKGVFNVKFDYHVVDEAHFLRNNTQKSKGTIKLGKLAKHRLALTGTPATNKPEDVIPIMQYLHPGAYSKWGLIEYFFNTSRGRFALEINGVKSEKYKEWVQFLNRFSVVMKTKDHMDWIPEITNQDVYVEMDAKQNKVYNQMVEKFKVTQKDGKVKRTENVLTQLGKLIQISLDPSIVNADGDSAKTKWIKSWLSDDQNENEHLVIWSTSKEYLKRLNKDLAKYKPVLITGDVKMADRQGLVDQFQSGKKKILLAGIQVLNAGYTLDKATTMMFANRDWNATTNEQANFRLIPTQRGKVDPKTIIDIKVDNGIDDYIEKAYKEKLSMTDIVNNFHKYLGGDE